MLQIHHGNASKLAKTEGGWGGGGWSSWGSAGVSFQKTCFGPRRGLKKQHSDRMGMEDSGSNTRTCNAAWQKNAICAWEGKGESNKLRRLRPHRQNVTEVKNFIVKTIFAKSNERNSTISFHKTFNEDGGCKLSPREWKEVAKDRSRISRLIGPVEALPWKIKYKMTQIKYSRALIKLFICFLAHNNNYLFSRPV